MLASPCADLGWLEDAVVVRIHTVELGSRPPRRALFGALDELLPGEAAGARRRRARRSGAWRGGGLLICLGKGGRRQQRQSKKSDDDRTHILPTIFS